MPSDMSLKLLIAVNAVQMFITLLLVATMASAGLSARSGQSSPSTTAVSSDAGPLHASSGDPWPAVDGDGAGDANNVGAPPGTDGDSGVNGAEEGAPAPKTASSGKNLVILQTYLNLVARRLEVAAEDSGESASQWLPSKKALTAAAQSGDPDSTEFKAVLEQLKGGYEALGMTFPAPPASAKNGG